MKKFIVILIGLLVIILGFGVYVYKQKAQVTEPKADGNQPPIIGGDRDKHDCIGSAGYSWCEAAQKCQRIFEEFCADNVNALVDEIKKTTEVSFTLTGDTEFNWIVGKESVTTDAKIKGVLYQAKGITLANYNRVEEYLARNFEADSYNLADGVEGGLRGYYLAYMVCDLNFKRTEMRENDRGLLEPVGDSLDVKLECGYFNKNDIPNLIVGQLIKEELGKKYQKAVSEVSVKIIRRDETHVAGSVVFGQGGQGEGGLFLAVKSGDSWQLVYDGNGSVNCQELKGRYGFSDDMLRPQFCD